jgi:hypothetical protein
MADKKAAADTAFKLVAKFADAEGSKLQVTAVQKASSGEYEVKARHTKHGEKRSVVGMKSTFPASQKDKATAKFNEMVAGAEKVHWLREQKVAKVAGFDVIPAAVVKK